MSSTSPSGGLDLVVIGGLTVDRFADGSAAPGGAVLHIARALAPRDVRMGLVTTAGSEPQAQAGLAELRALAASVDVAITPASITFGHAETTAGRELVLERRGGEVPAGVPPRARAVLFAPVADEITVGLMAGGGGSVRGAILQGWLRSTAEGEPVTARALASSAADLRGALRAFDLVIGSSEDLRADAADALGQLQVLRAVLGPQPVLVVTDGGRGPWLDDGSGPRHLPVADRVAGVPTIGAGDMFAAFMLLALAEAGGAHPRTAAEMAMGQVTEVLRGRAS